MLGCTHLHILATKLEQTGKAITRLPLTISQRCSKAVAKVAQQWVSDFKAREDAPDGEVITTNTDAAMDLYKPGDMVICRCNAPLTGVAYRLIKRGIKAVIKGKDIGEGLIELIDRLNAADIGDLLVKLDRWQTAEILKVQNTRRETTVTQQVEDKADCIRHLSECCENVSALKKMIGDIFAPKSLDGQSLPEPDGTMKDAVLLSSVHKAKGLESDRVFWLKPEIEIRVSQPWQAVQETNLRYVASTRAKRTLVKVHDAGRGKGKQAPTSPAVAPCGPVEERKAA